MNSTETAFVYRQKTHPLADTEGMTRAIHEDGFALIPGVLSRQEVNDVRAAIDRLRPFGFDGAGGVTDHYKCVFNREKIFLDLIDRPGVVDLAESTMGVDCHIIGESAWRSRPGHNGWSPHTDRVYFELPPELAADPRVKLPVYLCTAHYYLDDLTLDLAPTWVIPGSHKSCRSYGGGGPDDQATWNGRPLEPVLCKAGDVLFFRSEIWHTGSKNATKDRTRYLLQVHYSHRWMVQQFSPYLTFALSNEVLATANPRQRRLLGDHKAGAYD